MAGRPLVDDALAGYLRDDLWAQNGTMYFVSAAPAIKRDPPVAYVGAVVLGHKVTNELAQKLVSGLNVDVGVLPRQRRRRRQQDARVRPREDDQTSLATLKDADLAKDCQSSQPIELRASNEDYTGARRAPARRSADRKQAFYTVLHQAAGARSASPARSRSCARADLSFGSFPWILVGGAFSARRSAVGIALMLVESDRPLRKLAADAVRLAKGEKERLGEDEHRGKFGSIARSVNIHIDKLGREAKSASTNLDSLLGPAPEGSLGTIDLLAGALPPARPGGPAPAVAPPPSDFRFSDPGKADSDAAPPTPPSRPTPPPACRRRRAADRHRAAPPQLPLAGRAASR